MTLIGTADLKIFFNACAKSCTVQAAAFLTKISPGRALVKAKSTRSTESLNGIKNRVISGTVRVRALFCLICSINKGITEPREHMTFPYRTQDTTVLLHTL